MPRLAKLADWINTEVRGTEMEGPLMRGMNPESLTKSESTLDTTINSFEDMVELLLEDNGFQPKNKPYYQSDPNSTDSPEIAASYATTETNSDYLLMAFSDDVIGYHMFGREYHIPEAPWDDVETLIVSEENSEYLESQLDSINNPPSIQPVEPYPEFYREEKPLPEGVSEGKADDWYDLMWTVEQSMS